MKEKLDLSWPKTFVLAEEIGREVAKNTSIPSQPEVIIKTDEKRPRHPHIINYSIHEADKWYEIKFPRDGVKSWSLSCRENYDVNYCFEPTASTYKTLTKGATLSEDTAPQGIHAIYVKSPEADVTIELELWLEAPSLELFP